MSYTIVDTNQTLSYDVDSVIAAPSEGQAFYGQDAQYQGNAPSYQDNGDGTITDLNTGLVWAQTYVSEVTYTEAVNGASSYSLAGYTDWRLPTLKELYSLMDFSGYTGSDASNSNPYINDDVFGFTYGDTASGDRFIDAQYWSATEYVSTTMNGNSTTFGVNFADGRIKGYPNSEVGGTDMERYVRYVRAGEDYGVNSYNDNGDGTITDSATSLMWTQADNGSAMSWQDALAWAEDLTFAGYSDWRLPNAKELQSIVDYSRSPDTTNSAAIDPLFEVTKLSSGNLDYPYYWSSTTHVEGQTGDYAVYIAFGEASGFLQDAQTGDYNLTDVHGAGAQRSDPKSGDPDDFPNGFGPQGDVISIYNYARAVRDIDSSSGQAGTSGNDRWTSTVADETFNGGEGTDIVEFSLQRSSYTVTQSDSQIRVSGPEGDDTLVDIERLYFSDQALAYEAEGVAGQVYRLYQAAFDRTPDSSGLGYWINSVDNGGSLGDAAGGFLDSTEFKTLYGDPITDDAYLTALYNNVLNRTPDADGLAYWTNVLGSGQDSRAGVLVGFSESTENKANVASQINSGISYELWPG